MRTITFEVIAVRPRSTHSPEYQLFAGKLRAAREAAGLTQREVAARLGKPPSFPHKVETSERELNVIELMDYCAALEIDFAAFVADVAADIRKLRR